MNRLSEPLHVLIGFWKDEKRTQCALHLLYAIDFIKVYLDFRNTSCVLTEFGSYAAHNMFP